MPLLYNRVRETSTTTGTGNLTLAGAVTGFHAFNDKVATGTTVRYVIAHQSANEHEYGIGTFTATSTLARTTPLGGTSGTSPHNFTAGTKDVFVDALAEDFGYSSMPHRSGGYYAPLHSGATSTVVAKDQLKVMPFWVPERTTYTRHGIGCTAVASSEFRPGIYRNSNGLPGALVSDGGTLSCAATAFVEATISVTLDRGWYWIGGAGQVVNPNISTISGSGNVVGQQVPGVGSPMGAAMSYYLLSVSGALPDPFGTPTGTALTSFITWLKAA